MHVYTLWPLWVSHTNMLPQCTGPYLVKNYYRLCTFDMHGWTILCVCVCRTCVRVCVCVWITMTVAYFPLHPLFPCPSFLPSKLFQFFCFLDLFVFAGLAAFMAISVMLKWRNSQAKYAASHVGLGGGSEWEETLPPLPYTSIICTCTLYCVVISDSWNKIGFMIVVIIGYKTLYSIVGGRDY